MGDANYFHDVNVRKTKGTDALFIFDFEIPSECISRRHLCLQLTTIQPLFTVFVYCAQLHAKSIDFNAFVLHLVAQSGGVMMC